MLLVILIKSTLMLSPLKKKSNLTNIFCSCKDSNLNNNLMFPYAPFDYPKNNDSVQDYSDLDSGEGEPEHISIDNLYLEKKAPEVIINPYADPDKEYYGPY